MDDQDFLADGPADLFGEPSPDGAGRNTHGSLPVSQKTEKLTNGDRGDFGAWRRGGTIGVIRGGGRDAQDDAVAVLDLKGQGFATRAVLDGYPEGAPIKRVTRIDDGDGRDVVLTVHAARGIKKIPRLMAFRVWSRNASARTS